VPNLISREELTEEYISNTFDNTGDFTLVQPHYTATSAYESLYQSRQYPYTYIKLVDNVQLDIVSRVVLEDATFFDVDYKVIKLTTARYNRLKYVFSILLYDLGYFLMSDHTHTIKGSMNFWQKIVHLPMVETRVVNIETKYSRLYRDQPDHSVWGLDDQYFIGDELNTAFVEMYRRAGKINDFLYEYILTNQGDIGDRNNIRLTARVV
jgi:hypothetical protein